MGQNQRVTVSRDVSKILDHLAQQRFDDRWDDLWGNQAVRLADGIRESGLISEISELRADVSNNAARAEAGMYSLAMAIGASTASINAMLAQSNGLLRGIESLLGSPQATAAREYLTRAANAISNGWTREAILDLEKSVTADPYSPLAHVYLGIAHRVERDSESSIEHFRLAARYAEPDSVEVMAGALLECASGLMDAGRAAEAREVLAPHFDQMVNCPEFVIMIAVTGGLDDDELLDDALWLAPELALPAVLRGVPGAEAAANRVASADDSPLKDARAFIAALDVLASSVSETTDLRLTQYQDLLEHDHASMLALAGDVLLRAPGVLGQCTDRLTPDMLAVAEPSRFSGHNDQSAWEQYGVPVLTVESIKQSRRDALSTMQQIVDVRSNVRVHPWRPDTRPEAA